MSEISLIVEAMQQDITLTVDQATDEVLFEYNAGIPGLSAYELYLQYTTDDPVLTEEEFATRPIGWYKLTQAEYDALPVKDGNKLYVIIG